MQEYPPSLESEHARYDESWRKYNIYSRRYWSVFLSYIPGVFFFSRVLSFVVNSKVATTIIAIAWVVAWAVLGFPLTRFCCPRCGKRFFARPGMQNIFSNKCLNCGLHTYSYSNDEISSVGKARN